MADENTLNADPNPTQPDENPIPIPPPHANVLAIFTYLLYKQATTQSEAAMKSANASQLSASIAIRSVIQAESTYILNKRAIESSDAFTHNSIKISQASLNETQKSFNESINRFKNESDAYLEIETNPTQGSTFEVGKPFVYRGIIKNLGRYTIKMIESKVSIEYAYISPPFESVYKSDKSLPIKYIASQGQTQFTVTKSTVTQRQYDDVIKNHKLIFISGYVLFENQVDHNKKEYQYILQHDGLITTVNLFSDNITK